MKTVHKNMPLIKTLSFGLLVSMAIVSCKKDPDEVPTPIPVVTAPLTYNFTSIDTLSSKQHMEMLGEMITYIKTTHSATLAPVLDAQKLRDMYANANNPFTNTSLNTSGIQLKDQTGNAFGLQADMDALFTDAVNASITAATNPDTTTASNGVAGKLINGTRYVLVDNNGFEYKEFVEKGLMGAVLYYQAMERLNNIGSFDNTLVTGGTTAQERAWDQAFAYFGVPINFPTVTTGLKNWGSYCNSVSTSLGGATTVNTTIMNAWVNGRKAISAKDDANRDVAKAIVVATWEKVCAARFITYVKGAKTNITAQATFSHNLSEAVGFIKAFRYNSAKTISDADLNILMGYFQTGGTVNLYNVTTTNLDDAIDKMALLFNLDANVL